MKVIRDLMDAYSNYIGLPLVLVNSKNEIEYKVDGKDGLVPINELKTQLVELQRISLHLNNPTVVSVSDELHPSGIFYIITPMFKVNGGHDFLAAGPFREKPILSSTNQQVENFSFITLREKQIEEKINKMRKLHSILVTKSKVESNISVPTQIMDVLRALGDFECNIINYGQHVANILNQLLKIESFDFLGLAIKNEEDVFVIKYVSGERINHLVEKRFYIGEGLLGKAVILGEDFYWSKEVDTQRVDFFNRYGIFPNHLFGLPLKQEEYVTGILFGGNFKETIIGDNLLKLLKCIVRFISQRKNIDEKLMDSYYVQTIFANWLDLMDVTAYTNDEKYTSYKILDFCQILNKEQFSCVTTTNGDFIYRGEKRQSVIECHQNIVGNLSNPPPTRVWIEGRTIHVYLPFYGLFTVAFDKKTDVKQAMSILSMVEKLLQKTNEQLPRGNNETIFNLLSSSMQEMNAVQYELANVARDVMDKLANEFQMAPPVKKMLINLCRVLPYKEKYLAKQIAHTKEWAFLLEATKLLEGKVSSEEVRFESKLIAFIYCVIINGDKKNELYFLGLDIKEKCECIYKSCLYEKEQRKATIKVDIDQDEIEEIVDLKNVIETLNLTAREKEILYLILEGLNNHEVGEYLKISVHTVKNHVTNLFKKLNVSDRIQAMAKIYRIKYGEEKL